RFDGMECLDGAAVLALGLGLVAQKESPTIRVAIHAIEALSQGIDAVLLDGDVLVVGEDGVERDHGDYVVVIEGDVEAGGEQTGLKAGGAENGEFAEGDPPDGEELLFGGGPIGVDGVGLEEVELVAVLDAEDGEGGGEA